MPGKNSWNTCIFYFIFFDLCGGWGYGKGAVVWSIITSGKSRDPQTAFSVRANSGNGRCLL